MKKLLAGLLGAVTALSVSVIPTATASAQSAQDVAGIAIPGYRLAQDTPEQLNQDLDRLAATGAKWLRTDIVWGDIEYVRGQFNWSAPDRIAAAARARGLKVVGIATVLPAWARPAGTSWNYGPRTDVERANFAHFAELAAARYAGTIDTWEIWNEMNAAQFWAPAPSTTDYAALLKATYPAIKAANPSAVVMTGGTAWAGGSPDIPSVDWYRNLYTAGAKPYFDAAAVHPYFDFSGIKTQEMARAFTIRGIMDSAGDTAKQLWGTEIGAPTGGAASLSDSTQAAFVPQAYDAWSAIHDHGPLFWYTLKDTAGADREAFFGLVRTDGTLKPAYTALKSKIAAITAAPAPAPVRDTTPPAVGTSSPASGAVLSGQAAWSVTATDNVGVAKVQVLVDGAVNGEDTTAPYGGAFDTRSLTEGSHTVGFRAYDAAGNNATSAAITVLVRNVTAAGTTSVVALTARPKPRRRASGATFATTMSTSGNLYVDRLIIAVRDASGANFDKSLGTGATLAGVQSFSVTASLPRGTYSYRVAYFRNGAWTNIWPSKTVTVA